MKRLLTLTAMWLLLSGLCVAQELPGLQNAQKIKDDASYSIGVQIGQRMRLDDLDVNLQKLMDGLADGLANGETRLTKEQMNQAMEAFNQLRLNSVQAKGRAFLAANSKKPGVVTLPSGLQYKVLKQGAGATPKLTDRVSTHYRGTLINGMEFDSSYKRGEPTTFPVNMVIAGWTEALQKMKVGDKWQLFIPSDLAYGARGAGDVIGPHEALIFEMELLGIEE